MSEAKGQNEPSMEEILASIRRIIAEDGEPAGQNAPPPPPPSAAAAQPARSDGAAVAVAPAPVPSSAHDRMDEILELTEIVDEHGAVVDDAEPEPEPEPEPVPPPRAAAPPTVPEEWPAPPPPPPQQQPVREPVASADPADRLVSASTAAVSVAALAELHGMASRSGGRSEDIALGAVHRTLEELVRDMLKPMLQSWLDANLPDMVERLVREEIARMVRDARQR